ncbi:MAG: serine/threonine protein kinase [Actinomycetia bacterium]|nr:serine/threonine protein kinase [Actinomycetes bacterium]
MAADRPPDFVLAGFSDLRVLDRGGFSTVFVARQNRLGREVAVKVLDVRIDDENVRARFEAEAQIMGLLSTHPSIVTIFDAAFASEGEPCIVMELYRGDYGRRLKTDGQLGPREALSVGIRLCGALQTVHDAGILHLDIKPKNVFVSSAGEPALGDFGISTVTGDRSQRTVGGWSFDYSPPETYEFGAASRQSDLYSLGATLYHLVSGSVPFPVDESVGGSRERDRAKVGRHLNDPVPPLGRDDEPPGLYDIIATAMAKLPADRWPSALEFGRALQQIEAEAGWPITTMIIVDESGAAVVESGPDQGSTISRNHAESPPDAPAPASGPVPAWVRPLVLGIAALVVIGFALLAARGDENGSAEPPRTPVATITGDDNFFDLVAPPGDLVFEQSSQGATLSWVVEPETVLEVVRVDVGHETDPALTFESSPAVISLNEGENPCIEVRAIRGGRISETVGPICLSG